MTIECPKCKTDNPDTVKFCGECGTKLTPSEAIPEMTKTLETPIRELTRGKTFAGRYEIVEKLGTGGMGSVYRVEDSKIHEDVALKLIKPEIAADQKTIERFSNELKLARKIRHKNVCQMFDLGEAEGTHFITMEYVSGEDLKSFIRRSKQLSIPTALSIAGQICEGLEEAHKLGIVHRDLKPSNIMIDKNGYARIMDFGIARSVKSEALTGTDVMIGTPDYMSPEQVEGKEVDQRSDIYSLGVVLFEMLTGERPFKGDTSLSVAMKHKSEAPPNPKKLNDQIPEILSRMVLKCLEKDKQGRYQTVEELLSALNTLDAKKLHLAEKDEKKESIAVLPFANMSADPEQEYFADGMTEELITSLARFSELRVISRTSSMHFKGSKKTLPEIAQQLHVDRIVEGTVRRAGDRVRISAQLIHAPTDQHVWAESYERDLKDILVLQSEVARAIAAEIQVKLTPQERVRLDRTSRVIPDAYDAYLKGLQEFAKFTPDGFTKGLEFLEQSIRKDPHFAPSQAALAECLCWFGTLCTGPAKTIFPRAKAAAAKAVQLDETLAEAFASLALTKWIYDWDWIGAEKDFRRAIALNPSSARARYHYATFLMSMSRFDEAIAEASTVEALDPLSATSVLVVAWAYLWAGQYDDSIVQLRKLVTLDPKNVWAWSLLTLALARKKMISEAIAAGERASALSPPGKNIVADTHLAAGYVMCGKPADARALLEIWETLANRQYVDAGEMPVFYFWLGNLDRGFEWAYRGLEERSPAIPWYKSSALVATEQRSDPRWPDLLRSIGFPE